MVTANELLASVTETDRTFVIDNDLRTIKIPANITNLGVQSDDDVLTVYFQMPGTYCGVNLSEFNIRINYLNAAGEGDYHDVDDAAVQPDGTIRFSWTIGRHAASVVGTVEFNVCLKKSDSSGNVIKEFNTTTASLPILEGLEISEQVISEYNDILEQWRAKLFGVGDTEEARILAVSQEQQRVISEQSATVLSDIELKGSETLATIPGTYTEVYNMAEEALRTKADAIVLEAEGTVIAVNDASDDHIQNLKVFGRTIQDGKPTPDAPVDLASIENPSVNIYGKNLLKPKNSVWEYGGITYTTNADGSVTVAGTTKDTEDSTCHIVNKDSPLILPKGTYTLSGCFGGSEKSYRILIYSTEWKHITECVDGPVSFVLDEETSVFVYIWVYRGNTVNETLYPMICEGSFDSNYYECYKHIQSITLNHTLHGIPVTSGGNYTDENGQQWICDEVDFNRGVYIQRIGVFQSDESLIWTTYTSAYGHYGFMIWHAFSDMYSRSIGLCNQLPDVGSKFDNCVWVGVNDNCLYVLTKEWYDKGLDAWKAHLNEKPLDIIYVLNTPIETPLTSEEILAYKKLKTNRTNTTVLNDQNAHMVIAYSADTLTFLRDNQPKPTDEQITEAIHSYLDETGVELIPGPKGDKGDKGDPGDDYVLTEADKTEMVNAVMSALPTWEGGSY